MIAYHILCHDNFSQVARLVESLWTDEATFLIDIDDGQGPDTRALDAVRERGNVHVKRDGNIGWGGAGTLRKTLTGALDMLSLDPTWRYYVVLSGQDLPLKSNEVIRERLMRGDAGSISYLRSCPMEPRPLESFPVDNVTTQCRLWGDRGHTRVYQCPGAIDPQAHMHARRLVDVTEVGEKGEVFVGTADALLLRRRDAFFARYPFHVGANWFSLHRSLLEHMKGDPFTYELYDVLRTTFIPDESFFQTYASNSPFRDKLDWDYGRLILRPGPVPRVKVLDASDRTSIEAADELFGRKFDTRVDASIVDRVLAARSA